MSCNIALTFSSGTSQSSGRSRISTEFGRPALKENTAGGVAYTNVLDLDLFAKFSIRLIDDIRTGPSPLGSRQVIQRCNARSLQLTGPTKAICLPCWIGVSVGSARYINNTVENR